MKTTRKKVVSLLIGIFLIFLSVVILYGLILMSPWEDDLKVINRDWGTVSVEKEEVTHESLPSGENRIIHELLIRTQKIGDMKVAISRPLKEGPWPVLLIMGGLRAGKESLEYIHEHGPCVLVGYQYPYAKETWKSGNPIVEIPRIRDAVMRVPSQVSCLVDWISAQPWADDQPISLLGFSLGGLFSPAIHRVANEKGIHMGPGIIAFAGAGIGEILDANLREIPWFIRSALISLLEEILCPIEPAYHLPHMTEPVLFIHALRDEKIPSSATERMKNLKPQSWDMITMDAQHMNAKRPELTKKVIEISKGWLKKQGVLSTGHDPR